MILAPPLQPLLVELARIERLGAPAEKARVIEEKHRLDALRAERNNRRSATAASRMSAEDYRRDAERLATDLQRLQRRQKADQQALGAAVDAEQRRDLNRDLRATLRRLRQGERTLHELRRQDEAAGSNSDASGAQSDALDDRVAAAQRAYDAAVDALAHEERRRNERREYIRAELPEDALSEFDANTSPYGAATFDGRTCGGCYIMLPPGIASGVRSLPAQEVPTCPECGTFLVREAMV